MYSRSVMAALRRVSFSRAKRASTSASAVATFTAWAEPNTSPIKSVTLPEALRLASRYFSTFFIAQLATIDDDHEGNVGEEGHAHADAQHGHQRDDGEQGLADQKRYLRGKIGGVVDVVAEAADRLARRLRHGLRAGAVEDAGEHVLAQQRAGAEAVQEVAVDIGENDHRLRQRQTDHDGGDRLGRQAEGWSCRSAC